MVNITPAGHNQVLEYCTILINLPKVGIFYFLRIPRKSENIWNIQIRCQVGQGTAELNEMVQYSMSNKRLRCAARRVDIIPMTRSVHNLSDTFVLLTYS